jgi:hypothetical protein
MFRGLALAKTRMAKKGDEAPLDGGFCWCSREIAAIIVISIVGMSMLVPGFLLRLEDVRFMLHPVGNYLHCFIFGSLALLPCSG